MDGWIKLHRQIMDSAIWPEYAREWLELLMLANHSDRTFLKKGQVVTCKRGQVAISIAGLADRWGCSRGRVSRFLDTLETLSMASSTRTPLTTVITITNYDLYQADGHQTEHQTDIRRTSDGHTKRIKELKNDKKTPQTPQGAPVKVREFFDRWNTYAARRSQLKTCRKLTDVRAKKIAERLKDPGWLDDFCEATKCLPIGSSAWQPSLDWLIRNSHNVYMILEGAFDWKMKDDPAVAELAIKRRRRAEAARIQQEQLRKEGGRAEASITRKAIGDILNQPNGSGGGQSSEGLLFG